MILCTQIIILCVVLFIACYLNTGSDERNIRSFSSYPDEIQEIVRKNPVLKEKIKKISPVVAFIYNLCLFVVLFFVLGLSYRQKNFISNFMNLLILGQCFNAFDFLVIDMLWWRHTKRIRFTGTEGMGELYKKPKKHIVSFLKAIVLFAIVATIDGFLLTLI